jgi:sulfate-transporting ATPase
MAEITLFVLLGLGVGAIYALAALGVVVIARGSGVLSFAQGGFALVGAYVYFEVSSRGGNLALATVCGTVAAGLVGLISYLLVFRLLRDASALTKSVATLGVLAVIRGSVELHYGTMLRLVTGPLPQSVSEPFRGVRVPSDHLWLVAVACVAAAVIWVLLRFTRFGLSTRGVAENERTAAAIGIDVDRVAALNWVLGAALGGLAGVLVAPVVGLSPSGVALLSLSGLAAALVGQFRNVPLTVSGGLLVGVAQSLLSRYVQNPPGLTEAAPFLVVILILVVRPTTVTRRGRVLERLPRIGSGTVRPLWLAAAIAAAGVLTLTVSAGWADALTTTYVASAIALSLVVLTGYTNQLSLAQHAIAGVGALIAARTSHDLGLPFPLCLAFGMVGVVPIALCMSLPAMRTRGVELAVVTLGFSVVIEQVVLSNDGLTGGLAGTAVHAPSIGPISLDPVSHPNTYALLCLAYLAVMSLAVLGLRRSRLGRQMIAIRDNAAAAEALGVRVVRTKVVAFAIASMIAAGGGVFAAFQTENVTYGQFGLNGSIADLMSAVVGGVGFILGPLVGTLVTGIGVTDTLMTSLIPSFESYVLLIGGLGLVAALTLAPDGIAGVASAALRERLPTRLPAPAISVGAARKRSECADALDVRAVGVSFAGVRALDGVSFELRSGEILGLVGANGAGKSTVIDAICGRVPRHDGSVAFERSAVDRWPTWKRARAGISRSFQSLELFEDMTVLENLLVGAEIRQPSPRSIFRRGRPHAVGPAAARAIRDLGLEEALLQEPGQLSHGARRKVAIARALTTQPAVLLLDEPAAGLDRREADELGRFLAQLAAESSVGIVLVEHDVQLVLAISNRVVALESGRAIATGSPHEVRSNDRVIESFLGPRMNLGVGTA